MPTPTYTALANITLGSSASSVTFSSIPATYRDLILTLNGVGTGAAPLRLRYNADSGSNYTYVGTSNVYSEAGTTTSACQFFDIDTNRYFYQCQIMDYSATDKQKTTITRGRREPHMEANRWANTAAITSISVSTPSNAMAAGFTITLFGIAS